MGKDYSELSYEELREELKDNYMELSEAVGWMHCFQYLETAAKSKRQKKLLEKLGGEEAMNKMGKSVELIMRGLEMKAEISRRKSNDTKSDTK